ncbi:hypothetical protein MEO40_19285 [Dolichospermum sp. ST_sed1]|nr:hypothetical protein [Dolichospermum sp. ST_sed1]
MMQTKRFILSLYILHYAYQAEAGITLEPYFGQSSIAPIMINKSVNTATEKSTPRFEKGLRTSINYNAFNLDLSLGQNDKTTTTEEREIIDEYGDIDFSKEIDFVSTVQNSETQTKIKDKQNKFKATLFFNPEFSSLIVRMKMGVTLTHRTTTVQRTNEDTKTINPSITLDPHASGGFGIRFSQSIFFMIEYNTLFYKFPETKPMEREVSISIGYDLSPNTLPFQQKSILPSKGTIRSSI